MEVALVKMKRSNKEPEIGDIFIIQPEKELYYYGKVIQTKINSINVFYKGMYLIYIYDKWTRGKKSDINLDSIPLLIPPMIVNKRPWTMGYIETIKKSYVSDYDLSIDYGFWDVLRNKHYDIKDNILLYAPEYSGIYGLSSYGAIAKEVHRAISRKKR